MKIYIHCPIVSEVMSEVASDFMPGVRLLSAEDFEERVPVPVKSKAPRRSPWLAEVLRMMPEVQFYDAVTVSRRGR